MAAWEDAARRDFFGGYDSSETGNGVRFGSLGESLLAQTLLYSTRLQGAVRPYKWQITFNSDLPWSLEQDPLAYTATRPRLSPNQPRKTTLGARSPIPTIEIATGTIRTERSLSRPGRPEARASFRDPRATGCGNAKRSGLVCRKSP